MRGLWALAVFLGVASAQVVSSVPDYLGTKGTVLTKEDFLSLMAEPGDLHLVVPELSNWAYYVAETHRAQSGDDAYLYVPRPVADQACPGLSTNVHAHYLRVLPTQGTVPAVGLLVPPEGGDFGGMVLEGSGLYRPIDFQTRPQVPGYYDLVGPKKGRAYVYGSWDAGDLQGKVWLYETHLTLDAYPTARGTQRFGAPWNGRFTMNVGNGDEAFRLDGYDPGRRYQGDRLTILDASGRERGYAVLTSSGQETYSGVDCNIKRTLTYCGNYAPGTVTGDVGAGPERFYIRECRTRCTAWIFGVCVRQILECKVYDTRDWLRGAGWKAWMAFGWGDCGSGDVTEITVCGLRRSYQKQGEEVEIYLKGWHEESSWVYKGIFPMLPGGRFRVEGDDYTATAFAAYKRPLENTIHYVKDSALAAYLAQQIGLGRGTNVGDYLARQGMRTGFDHPVSLEEYCAGRSGPGR